MTARFSSIRDKHILNDIFSLTVELSPVWLSLHFSEYFRMISE